MSSIDLSNAAGRASSLIVPLHSFHGGILTNAVDDAIVVVVVELR